jgi:hypothetical protein
MATKMRVKIEAVAETYRLTSKGYIPIALRLVKDRKKKVIRLGVSIEKSYWDATKNKIKPNCDKKSNLF